MKDKDVWRKGERNRERKEWSYMSICCSCFMQETEELLRLFALGACQYMGAWFQWGTFFYCYAVNLQMENNSRRTPLPVRIFFRLLFTAQHTILVLYELQKILRPMQNKERKENTVIMMLNLPGTFISCIKWNAVLKGDAWCGSLHTEFYWIRKMSFAWDADF